MPSIWLAVNHTECSSSHLLKSEDFLEDKLRNAEGHENCHELNQSWKCKVKIQRMNIITFIPLENNTTLIKPRVDKGLALAT